MLRRPILRDKGESENIIANPVTAKTAEAQAYACMVSDAVVARTAEAHKFVSTSAFAVSAMSAIVGAANHVVSA